MPETLTLSASGAIMGTPRRAGLFFFTVEATSAEGKRFSRRYTLIVSPREEDYGPRPDLPAKNGKQLRACQREPLDGKSYRLSADIGNEDASLCLRLQRGTHLDLAGHTVRGRIAIEGDPSDIELSNGSVHCSWGDDEGNAGCVHVSGEGGPAEPLIIRDLEIGNSAQESRALHIDWPSTTIARKPTIVIEHLRVRVPSQPRVSRSYAISVIAKNQYLLVSSNDLVCSATARACQALMCYGVGQCKVHHNRIVMEQNMTDENGRAILFDGHTEYGEAWNNDVIVNNNRGVRIRDSRNIRVHHNTFSSITPEQNALAVLHIGDPDSSEPNELQSSVDENLFMSRGGAVLFARGATKFRFANNVIECSPKCPPFSLGRVRGPVRSELTFWRNRLVNVEEPSISLGPNTKLFVCESGEAAGEGTAVKGCPSR